MAQVNYSVGDTIEYRTIIGSVRKVVVEERDPDIKNGRPGFAGECIYPGSDLGGCWGYDSDIIRVVEKCKSAGN